MIRRLVRIAAGVIAALILLLLVDWAVATVRKPKDDKLVKDIQEKVKTDASLAPQLAAEQKRVTDYRKSRKVRDSRAADGLIVAASSSYIAPSATCRVVSRGRPSAPCALSGAHRSRRRIVFHPPRFGRAGALARRRRDVPADSLHRADDRGDRRLAPTRGALRAGRRRRRRARAAMGRACRRGPPKLSPAGIAPNFRPGMSLTSRRQGVGVRQQEEEGQVSALDLPRAWPLGTHSLD